MKKDHPISTLNPISNTAFYCCGVRMRDATKENPVCGDRFAKLFMDSHGLKIYEELQCDVNCNISVIARHRIIDDVLLASLAAVPGLCIVTIGAGFDARPYRFKGGLWIELDDPQLIAYKNKKLPTAACENDLHRMATDFSCASLHEKLAPFSTLDNVLVILEGVLLYLSQAEIKDLVLFLQTLFPRHHLVCDLVTRRAIARYGKTMTDKLKQLGVSFHAVDNPATIFIDNGYCLDRMMSIVEKAVDFLDATPVHKIMLKYLLMPVSRGNVIGVFGLREGRTRAV